MNVNTVVSQRPAPYPPPSHWKRLSKRFGIGIYGGEAKYPNLSLLRFLRKRYRLTGDYRGRLVRVKHYKVSEGITSPNYCGVRIETQNPSRVIFSISENEILSRIGKKMGMEDVKIGDERIDSKVIINGNKPEFMTEALPQEIKDKIAYAWGPLKARGTLEIKDHEVSYDESGTFFWKSTVVRFEHMIDLLCDLGDFVAEYEKPSFTPIAGHR